jgi:hypothetical protein
MRNSKIKLRFYEISLGLSLALTATTIWGWITAKDYWFSGLWVSFCLVTGFAFMWGRKLMQKSADKVLLEDQRPPVLYLRSFKDDAITSSLIDTSTSPVSFTEEEFLMEVLNDFGPCIAIGQPGEKIPDLGAARMYVADDQWQDKVRELLISSRLVVLRAGRTKNFLWEVEKSIQSVTPRNLIILIPKTKNVYSQFHKLANQSFPKPLPESIGESNLTSGIASLHGFFYFDDDWTPHFTKFEFRIPFWQREVVFPIMYVMRNSLAPIYERFGILMPKTEYMNYAVVAVTFVLSMLAIIFLT